MFNCCLDLRKNTPFTIPQFNTPTALRNCTIESQQELNIIGFSVSYSLWGLCVHVCNMIVWFFSLLYLPEKRLRCILCRIWTSLLSFSISLSKHSWPHPYCHCFWSNLQGADRAQVAATNTPLSAAQDLHYLLTLSFNCLWGNTIFVL